MNAELFETNVKKYCALKGVSPTVDRDFVIATVAGSAAGASEAAEEAAGEAEA